MRGAFKPYNRHRLETTAEVNQRYQSAGTKLADEPDIEFFEELLASAMKAPTFGRADENNKLTAWLNYELGLAYQQKSPSLSSRHYTVASKLVGLQADARNNPKAKQESQRNVALINLMRARNDPGEHEHKLNQRATVKQLGQLMLQGVKDLGGAQNRKEIFGQLSETAVAGAFLAFDGISAEPTFIPAPASPRQDSPHRANRLRFNETIAGLATIDSLDFNLLRYEAGSLMFSGSTSLQVKTKNGKHEDYADRYDPGVVVVCADQELFVSGAGEFRKFGQSLVEFGVPGATPDSSLRIARSNLELALEVQLDE